jgi:hypothetical protein
VSKNTAVKSFILRAPGQRLKEAVAITFLCKKIDRKRVKGGKAFLAKEDT